VGQHRAADLRLLCGAATRTGGSLLVSIDVVCTGMVFLDMTFEGLNALPENGRERWATELHETPGGAATTAIGIRRLGHSTAVVAPLGTDVPGRTLRRVLEAEGVLCAGPDSERTPVTIVLPFAGDRAMVTYEPPAEMALDRIERLSPRAVVTNALQLDLVPDGVAGYATVGDFEASSLAQR